MKPFVKGTLVFLGVVLVGIQFIPAKLNLSEQTPQTDFIRLYGPSAEIKKLLTVSCYDCHSNNTDYPWYSSFQPHGWFLQQHIDDGKSELNFSEFGAYSDRMKANKLRSMISQIEDNKMPLWSYTLMHRDAKLSKSERKALVEYLQSIK